MADIFIPELSESIKSGTVVNIIVKPGDQVKKGQTLLELETDKAVLEVPSPADGFISEVLVKRGDKVSVGQAVFRILSDGAAPVQFLSPAAPEKKKSPVPEQSIPAAVIAPAIQAHSLGPQFYESVDGTDVPAAPSVRRFAREIGINVGQIPGTGPNGRISIEDVKAFAKRLLTNLPTDGSAAVGIPSHPLPDFSRWGEVTREPMNAIRKKTAEHMGYAWATVPHVTHFAQADITELDKLRQQVSTPEMKLTVTPFIIKVIATALKNFPKFNASIDVVKSEIVFKKYVSIGVAIDTDHGLLVPVIKNAAQKTIFELARELRELSDKARARKLSLDDMQGGTFTITNLGGITGGMFTPIVNAPEVAILGISRAQLEPCYDYGSVCAPRLMLPLCLSYDHRLIDGADGARFIKWVCDAIQQPFLLELK